MTGDWKGLKVSRRREATAGRRDTEADKSRARQIFQLENGVSAR
jgi:hypothetical protein